MPKKPIQIERFYIEDAVIPSAVLNTALPHKKVIEKYTTHSTSLNQTLSKEIYRCNDNAVFVLGRMIFEDCYFTAFYNSYEPNSKFKTCAGVYLKNEECFIPFRKDNNKKWNRKTNHDDTLKVIEQDLADFSTQEAIVMNELDFLKSIEISEDEILNFLTRLYFKDGVLGNEQLSLVKKHYNTNTSTSFTYYDMLIVLLKSIEASHPKTWIDQHRIIYTSILNKAAENQDFVIQDVNVKEEELDVISPVEETVVEEKQEVIQPEIEELPLDSLQPVAQIETEFNFEEDPEIISYDEDIMEDDFTWDCVKCGSSQGPADIFYEGQLCGACAQDN